MEDQFEPVVDIMVKALQHLDQRVSLAAMEFWSLLFDQSLGMDNEAK